MSKGRKKLPDAIKRLQGTDQKCRMSGDVPIFTLVTEMPAPPEWMGETAKRVYGDVCRSMIELGLVNNTNFALLLSYAHMIGVHHEAEEAMSQKSRYMPVKGPDGKVIRVNVVPHHRVSMDALNMALKIASEFGITPAAQTKIMSLVKKPMEKNPFDEL